jgi:L-lactate utilization protein LutC
MPKTEIDYSNTIIYKITCKNPAITDVYVGHTTNFVQRKHAHKQSCKNEKSPNYTSKVYEVIRANGGWTNWQMEIINFFNCADHYAARKKEQEYFISLNATLNSIEPFPKPKVFIKNDTNVIVSTNIILKKPVFFCETCQTNCADSKTFEIHNNTNKHQKLTKKNEQIAPNAKKNTPNFTCEKCHFICCKNSDFNRHLMTAKHLKANDATVGAANQHLCPFCKNIFKHPSSLSRHKKKCEILNTNEIKIKPKLYEKDNIVDVLMKENQEYKDMMLEMMKSNNNLQKQVLELCKNSNSHNTVISNSNNNNKTFNMQFFLNEKCKDAMNLTEFVDSMQLEFSDLEDVGKLGYVEGISKIMIRKLNELDIYKRPIHCSDAKREIMYVKEDNVWEKEKNTNDHIRKAIKRVTHKNSGMLVPWSLANPNCMKYDHHLNDVYIRMMGQSMGGSGEFVDNENKIMKKIAKAVLIDKNS